MADEFAKRSHELMMSAMDVPDAERSAFVERACANEPRLKTRVFSLLAAIGNTRGFLDTPALGNAVLSTPGEARPPREIVGYDILGLLGAGGMAAVYEAQQHRPRRRVALKVLRQGLAGTSALRRFEFEIEALARLRHPHIAQIYEAGATKDEHGGAMPFIAMEFVPGAKPITSYAREHALDLRARLQLFITMCDAVQHGHQNGVIHRDVKPSNVLIDSGGAVKVIDFGIARPTDSQDSRITRHTDRGHLLGTLNYMSPEQGTGNATLDVRTDVYSLGVILYQLIADRLPHDLSNLSIPQAIRVITDEPPPRLGSIVPAARGDLDAITTMAMEKEPSRRYSGAAALAADVRRYLNHQPIEARPASAIDHWRKFARRHRAMVAGVGATFITLLVGVAATARMAYLADQARTTAEQRQAELEQVTAFQESQLIGIDVKTMGDRLRESLSEKAREAIARRSSDPAGVERDTAELDRLIEDVNFTSLALRNLDEGVLQRSREAIDKQFAEQPLLRARMLQKLANTMYLLGLPDRAEPVIAEALRLRRAGLGDDHADTLLAAHSLGSVLSALGRHDEAVSILRDVYQRRTRTLGEEHWDTLNTGNALGGALRKKGDLAGAESIWRATLEIRRRSLGDDDPATLGSLNNVGVIYAIQGKFSEAEQAWRELIERRTRLLGRDHADTRQSLGNLGMILQEQGKLKEALVLLEEDLAAARLTKSDDHPSTLVMIGNVAQVLKDLKEFARAESLHREALDRRCRLLGPEHHSTLFSAVMLAGVTLDKHIDGAASADELTAAERQLREAIAVQRRTIGDNHPESLESIIILSGILRRAQRTEEAEALGRECVARAIRMHGERHPEVARARYELGLTLLDREAWTDAEETLAQSHAHLQAIRGENHQHTKDAAQALARARDAARAAREEPAGKSEHPATQPHP